LENQKGLTLLEVIIVIGVLSLLWVFFMAAAPRVKKVPQRQVCGTNLKAIGSAMTVYANDYEDAYPVQCADGSPLWATATDGWADADNNWATAKGITVGASLYILIREADMSPMSFVCPSGAETIYDGRNPNNLDITELWDFGQWTAESAVGRNDGIGNAHGPKNHISYAYHMPYGPDGGKGRYAADGLRGASFAMMADKNPWLDRKLQHVKAAAEDLLDYYVAPMAPYFSNLETEKWQVQFANAQCHGRQGQSVLYGDGHTSFEKTPDAGVYRDNIYTRQAEGGGEEAIRIGNPEEMPDYTIDNKWQPRSMNDSFLVNDDSRLPPYGAR